MIQRPDSLIGQYAGFVSRGAALLIDILIISGIVFGTIAVTNAFVSFFNLSDLLATFIDSTPLIRGLVILLTASGTTIFIILYQTLFWTLTGGYSPGKYVMGVRIVRTTGKRITFGRALLRYIFWWLSALPLGLGFFWVLIDNQRQGWHDTMAGTVVIYAWDARENPLIIDGVKRRIDYAKRTSKKIETSTKEISKNITSSMPDSAETPPE